MRIPILIISYDRPEGVSRILNTIKEYDQEVFIFVDGDKKGKQLEQIDRFKRIINNFLKDKPNFRIDFRVRTGNVGSAINVIDSIDECFKKADRLIIIEDDLDFKNSFLNFVHLAFPILEANKNIKMITGTNPFPENSEENQIHWTRYPIVWGWATNRSSWLDMRQAIFQERLERRKFENRRTYSFFNVGKKRSLSVTVDAWDLPLAGNFHANSWQCLVPPQNLVRNIGFDASASHTFENEWPLGMPINETPIESINLVDTSKNPSLCLDEKMEKFIYQIKWRHNFSNFKLTLKEPFTSRNLNVLNTNFKAKNKLDRIVVGNQV